MEIGISCGHHPKLDSGAIGNGFREADLTRELGALVREKLFSLGHRVVNCSPDWVGRSLGKRCEIANDNMVDFFVDLHFNAYNTQAHGTEILYISKKGLALAEKILPEIVDLGFRDRGCKYRGDLYVLKATRMPAILIECCFIDSWKDIMLYNAEKMADAIARGLVK